MKPGGTCALAARVSPAMNRREFLATGLSLAPLVGCGRLPVVAAREPVALVTADTEAHVAVVSLVRASPRAATCGLSPGAAQHAVSGGGCRRSSIYGAAGRGALLEAGRRGCGGSCAASRRPRYCLFATRRPLRLRDRSSDGALAPCRPRSAPRRAAPGWSSRRRSTPAR